MDLEFRKIHLDMLALPMALAQQTLSAQEQALSHEFVQHGAVTCGIVLANKPLRHLRYQVVYGAEIVRAANHALLEYVPCLIAQNFSATFIELIDVRSRADMAQAPLQTKDVIEQAMAAYQRIKGAKLSFRQAESIAHLGKKSTLYTEKRLAHHLHPSVQTLLRKGQLSKSAGRSISYVAQADQYPLAIKAMDNRWTVRDIELEKARRADTPVEASMWPDIALFQDQLEQRWSGAVQIKPKTRRTGRVIFAFYQLDELSRLSALLATMSTPLTYRIKGEHRPGLPSKHAGHFELVYTDLNMLEQLSQIL